MMRTSLSVIALLLFCVAAPLQASEPPPDATGTVSATVEFGTGFPTPLTVDAALLDTLPSSRVQIEDAGINGTWDGVAFVKLLALAGAPLGEAVDGSTLTKVIVVTALDGNRVVFSLAELDPALGDTTATLAFARDGKPLSDSEGPYRLVVSGHGTQARWLRQVAMVELFDAPGSKAAAD